MKKLLTLFLAVLLIVSTLFSLPILSSGATSSSANLIYDGRFDETEKTINIQNWTSADLKDFEKTHKWLIAVQPRDISVDSTTGNKYISTLNSINQILQSVAIEENTDYQLTFKARIADTTAGISLVKFGFVTTETRGTYLFGGAQSKTLATTDTDWTEFTADISTTTLTADTVYALRLQFTNVEVDNICLAKKVDDLIYDGGLEATEKTINIQNLTSADLKDFEKTHKWLIAVQPRDISVDAADGNNKYISTLNSINQILQSVAIESNSEYQLSFDVRIADTTAGTSLVKFGFVTTETRGTYLFGGVQKKTLATTDTDWTEFTADISTTTLTADTVYALRFQFTNVEVDNISLVKKAAVAQVCNVAVQTEGNGSAIVSANQVDAGKEVTFTATPEVDESFLGWYKEGSDTPVSSDAVYTVTVTEDLTLTGKFTTNVTPPVYLIYDGGFDETEKTINIQYWPSADLKDFEKTHKWLIAVQPRDISVDATNGNKYISTLNSINQILQSVAIEPNSEYQLSFDARIADATAGTSLVKFGFVTTETRGTYLFDGAQSKTLAATDTDWTEFTADISTTTLTADTVYALRFQFTNVEVDNIALTKKEKEPDLCNVFANAEGNGTVSVTSNEVTLGTDVTFTATPKTGETFLGWYKEGSDIPVSSDAVYTVTVMEDLTLIGKFTTSVTLQDGILYDGDFSDTALGRVPTAESYDTVTYESAHIWYRPSGYTAVVEEGGSRYLELNNYLYQSVKIKANTKYVLNFIAKTELADASLKASFRALKNRSTTLVTSSADIVNDGEWSSYSVIIEVGELSADYSDYVICLYSGTSAGDGNKILIDDISLEEFTGDKYIVDAIAYRSGRVKVDAKMVEPGTEVTFTAIPNEGATFVGWFEKGFISDGAVSTDIVYKRTVTDNTVLYGIFASAEHPAETYYWNNMDAELGDTSYWKSNIKEDTNATFKVSSEVKHGGNYAFEVITEAGKTTVSTTEPILLKGGTVYTISCYVKSTDNVYLRPMFFTGPTYKEGTNDYVHALSNIRKEIPVTHTIGEADPIISYYTARKFSNITEKLRGADDDGWLFYSMSFTTAADDDGVFGYLGFRNQASESDIANGVACGGSYYIDDITVTEQVLDTSPVATEENYCEYPYNLFEGTDFEDVSLEDTTLGELPDWFSIVSNSENAYLNVKAGNGAYLVKLNTAKSTWYTVGFDWMIEKAGSSYIGISTVPPTESQLSNPTNSKKFAAFYPAEIGSFNRSGFKFYSGSSTEVYLIFYSGSNELNVDNMMLFTNTGYSEDVNNVPLLTYDYDGDGVEYDALWLKYESKNNGSSSSDEENVDNDDYTADGEEEFDETSPGTGDNTFLPIAILIFTCCAFMAFITYKKRGVTNEK